MASVAGWLVVELSLLSNKMFTVPSLGVTMNPLLVVAVSQFFTAAVASTVMKLEGVEMESPLNTAAPGTGAFRPVTPDSVHEPLATEMFTVPAAVTLLTNSVSVAFETLAAVVPAGSVVRSNSTTA
jgi:hypothetical protein